MFKSKIFGKLLNIFNFAKIILEKKFFLVDFFCAKDNKIVKDPKGIWYAL